MQDPNVEKLFQEQAKYYSIPEQSAAGSPLVSIFLNWAKSKPSNKRLKICEFGGGGGILLNSIRIKANSNIVFYNAEIVEKYRRYQISSKIKFRLDSILDSKFPDNYFDAVVIRDVLHHLIGKNSKETTKNQKRALNELKRVTKPNGLVLVEELVEQHAIVARMIYWLSKINTKIGIRSRFLEISPHTIVAFLTIRELETMVEETFGSKKNIKKLYLPTHKEWQVRLVHLGFSSGKLILKITSGKSTNFMY